MKRSETTPPATAFQISVVIRRYRNFAPFVRQTGKRKAQTRAKAVSPLKRQFPDDRGLGQIPGT